jgi:hypothetical protein
MRCQFAAAIAGIGKAANGATYRKSLIRDSYYFDERRSALLLTILAVSDRGDLRFA